jgi:hypothetical protein
MLRTERMRTGRLNDDVVRRDDKLDAAGRISNGLSNSRRGDTRASVVSNANAEALFGPFE